MRLEAARGVDVAVRPPTIADLVEEWRTKAAPTRKSEATLSRLDRRLRQHLIPHLGRHRVDRLRPEDVEAWLTAEAASGQARRTIQDYRGDLRQVLAWAERRRLVTWNVAVAAELPLEAAPSPPKRTLTRGQRRRVYAALADDRSGPYFMLLAELGLRPGEADALTWADVDFDSAVVSITRSRKRGDGGAPLGRGRPKTAASSRRLRLTTACVTALHRRKTQHAAERRTAGALWTADERWGDLVFTSETGTPMHPSNVRRSLAAAIKRANVAIEEANVALAEHDAEPEPLVPTDFTPYEFGRHNAASLLVDAGASPYQVADQLGHTTTRMLDRHYRHRITEIVDTAAAIEHHHVRGDT